MKKKEKKLTKQVRFSELDPLELWKKLGLEQKVEGDDHIDQPSFESQEPKKVYEALMGDLSGVQIQGAEEAYNVFEKDFSDVLDLEIMEAKVLPSKGNFEVQAQQVPEKSAAILPFKGSLFIWGLLKEESKRSEKLSSTNHIFKDALFKTINRKSMLLKVSFEEGDFDEIISFLKSKKLVETSKASIRITRSFASLFHERYDAWLVF